LDKELYENYFELHLLISNKQQINWKGVKELAEKFGNKLFFTRVW